MSRCDATPNRLPEPVFLGIPLRTVLLRIGLILLCLPVCAVLALVAMALWTARGDPDIRLEQHRRYLESIRGNAAETAPNIVLVLADDLGYGDLSGYGSRAIRTPHLDALARDGARLVNFHSASPVCTPSRFGLLTGRYPTRGFMHSVFFPSGTAVGLLVNSLGFPHGVRGIPPDEITIAEALQSGGYATAMFGKWHLGDRSPHLPTEKGFDHFFGSYYSNDMKPYAIYRDGAVAIEAPADQTTLTRTFTSEILQFIDNSSDRPFLVYYASPFPHDPVHSSPRFAGQSTAGAYGDCVEELDWSVGWIRERLAERGLAGNTLFVFTSDNGPWHEGSPGHRRGRKNNSFGGGQTVPFIASWPGVIPASRKIESPAMAIDLFPTLLRVAGIAPPGDRVIDGTDLSPMLRGEEVSESGRRLFFVRGGDFVGVLGPDNLKYVDRHRSENSAYWPAKHGPFVFDLNLDPNESYDVSSRFPGRRAALAAALRTMNRGNVEDPRGWRTAE